MHNQENPFSVKNQQIQTPTRTVNPKGWVVAQHFSQKNFSLNDFNMLDYFRYSVEYRYIDYKK